MRDDRFSFQRTPKRPVPRKRMRNVGQVAAMVTIGALIVGGVIASVAKDYVNPQTLTCTVVSKDRVAKIVDGKSAGSDARVYTEQCGTLAVSDLLFVGQFRSADLYAKIEEGKTYEFETSGVRIGLLSSFPVIRSATEVFE